MNTDTPAYERRPLPQPKTAAERSAAYRARKGGKPVHVLMEDDIKAGLDAYILRHHQDGFADLTISQVINKLLRQQLLRKR